MSALHASDFRDVLDCPHCAGTGSIPTEDGELLCGEDCHYPARADLWVRLENAPENCEAVADLWHWSTNFEAGRGPAALLLDLIGYTADEYGCNVYPCGDGFPDLGYVELSKLGHALVEYANDPQAVREYVCELLDAEAQL
ncbi:MAG: hypothetical protein E6J20_19750 [Chloroflexi bacterium]|nr:MAG: hypothetical protein E6J20_19750 [Chloroflexota bacterium]